VLHAKGYTRLPPKCALPQPPTAHYARHQHLSKTTLVQCSHNAAVQYFKDWSQLTVPQSDLHTRLRIGITPGQGTHLHCCRSPNDADAITKPLGPGLMPTGKTRALYKKWILSPLAEPHHWPLSAQKKRNATPANPQVCKRLPLSCD